MDGSVVALDLSMNNLKGQLVTEIYSLINLGMKHAPNLCVALI